MSKAGNLRVKKRYMLEERHEKYTVCFCIVGTKRIKNGFQPIYSSRSFILQLDKILPSRVMADNTANISELYS
jgi:hypothetical protein